MFLKTITFFISEPIYPWCNTTLSDLSNLERIYHKKPSTIHLHITSKCPYYCKHCCSDAGPKGGTKLGWKDIKRIIDQAKVFGMNRLGISGGEPFTLEKRLLLRIIRYASRRGLLTSLNTNAYRLSKRYASELANVGLKKIKFSLYGTNPQTHDDFTGIPGSFSKIIQGIKLSKKEGMEVWVNSIITPKSLEENVKNLPSLLEAYELDVVQLSSIVPTGRGRSAIGYTFSEEGLKRAIKTLEKDLSSLLYQNYFFTITLFPDPENLPFIGRYCNYFVTQLVIDPEGDVIPCCVLPKDLKSKLGNTKRESLLEILSGDRIRRDPIFYWLEKGHEKMQKELGYKKISHDLCSTCIDMLYQLNESHSKR